MPTHGTAQPCQTAPEMPKAHSRDSRRPWGRKYAYIDDVVVDRLVAGQDITCTSFERRAAVVELHRRGWAKKTIGRHLRIDQHQVHRDLDRAGLVDRALLDEQRAFVAHRRRIVAALVAAGLSTGEIGLLLGESRGIIKNDRHMSGCPANRWSRGPLRPVSELRHKYGHLLHDALDVAS